MTNPYRKLFNLFAFSLLAFAIYLNFFNADDMQSTLPRNAAAISQTTTTAQAKQPQQIAEEKTDLQKTEKKN